MLTLSFNNEAERAEPLTATQKMMEFCVGYSRELINQSPFRRNESGDFATDVST